MQNSFINQSLNISGTPHSFSFILASHSLVTFYHLIPNPNALRLLDLMNSSFTLQEVLSEMMESLALENEKLENYLSEKNVGKDAVDDVDRNVKTVETTLKKYAVHSKGPE